MNFIRFAVVCCFLTVITTLGIHLDFSSQPAEFEQRVLLFKDTGYLFKCWWIIVHCLLVIVAMWGMALLQIRRSVGLAGLGFLFFAVFGITEITRQMFVLFYVNGLREQYVVATSPTVKEALRFGIQTFSLTSNALFGVFILAFGLGNFFYGLSLRHEQGFGKILSSLLLFWSTGVLVALGNEFWRLTWLDGAIHWFNLLYQPLMRGLVGLWLWQQARELKEV